jgi:ubiquinone biosynthesis protein
MIGELKREDVRRLYKIASVMIKYGFGPWLDGASKKHKYLIFLKGFSFYRNSEALNLPKEVRMRKALEELGPIFTKLGQTLSTRADLFERMCLAKSA